MKDVKSLRKADFWTSIVLFALGVAMFIGATTFPMTDSYGGVQNVWYVSPALFPMIIASTLVILSLVLFANAIMTEDNSLVRSLTARSTTHPTIRDTVDFVTRRARVG